jgi:hypothetical protein
MATRALIGFIDDDRNLIATYNHYDGYPDSLGAALEAHYNDDINAKKIASEGYISYLDPETGEIDVTNASDRNIKPKIEMLDGDPYEAGLQIGSLVDQFGGNYGYVWFKGEWHMVKNAGIANMAKALEDKLEDGEMFMSLNEDVVEEGYEAKWKNFINEAKQVDFEKIEKYIEKETIGDDSELGKQTADIALDAYIDSLKNDFRLGKGDDYMDFTMDDYVEDFENYVADRMDS